MPYPYAMERRHFSLIFVGKRWRICRLGDNLSYMRGTTLMESRAMDENHFFREAATRLCSSLRLAKAMQQCLLYIRDHIPADTLSLHLFDPGLGFIETVADATPEAGVALSVRTQLPLLV